MIPEPSSVRLDGATAEEIRWVADVWSQTLQIYAWPGVAERCLALQDRHGVCIPTLFCLLLAAVSGTLPPQAELEAACAEVEEWREKVIVALRHARRAVGHVKGTDSAENTVYARLKAVELDAERELMTTLSLQLFRQGRHLRVAPGDALQQIKTVLPIRSQEGLAEVGELFYEMLVALSGNRFHPVEQTR